MADNQNNPQGGRNFRPNPNLKKKGGFNFYWIYGIIAVVFLALQFFSWNGETEKISFDKFKKEMLAKHDVEKIVIINEKKAEIYIKKDSLKKDAYKDVSKGIGGSLNIGPHFYFEISSVESFRKDLLEAENEILASDTLNKSKPEQEKIVKGFTHIIPESATESDWSREIFSWVIPIVLMVVLWIFIMRRMGGGAGGGGQIFNIGKSKAQLFDKDTSVNINFNDVAGLEEAKVEVMEIVDFLKNPKKYTDLGGKIPKGALLVGPPGTGKTLLAKAVAGEAKVPFFSLSGSDFVEMFVGVGASRVRDLFRQAKEKAPCIIFIDEIDAIGRARGRNQFTGGNDERENTLNQLLTEMDGFGTNVGVIILAATNRADILDKALMRAGRFDRQIHLELPDLEERKAIFKVHIRPLKLDESVDTDFMAKQTPGFSGADIANVCNESALIAARNNKKVIGRQDFLDAIDRIVGGLEKRSKIISPGEKKVIAFHEAGHAAVSWMLQYAHPLIKVTIVPRGKALGAAWYLPEERQITTYEQMLDEITATLGGRASEDIVFGKISTGALNDLEKVTKQAYAMIVYFGLNKKIGNISYYDSSGASEYSFSKPYSETTAKTIDEELSMLIEGAYERAKAILFENKAKLEILAKRLLEKEVIFREDLEEIFGKRLYADPEEKTAVKKEKLPDHASDVTSNETKDSGIVGSIPKEESKT
jgi:ATP-dependent metalloprotease FtsH